MIRRPSLLTLTAAAAAVAAVANGVSAASPDATGGAAPAQTRLGAAIGGEIAARDRQAAERKRALDLRAQATRAAEARLKADLDARQQASAAPAAASNRPGATVEEEGDQYEDLARIYQAMKPAQAAVVFEQLDLDVQMRVAQKMRERSTAMMLGAMTPKGAAKLSMALARRYPVSSPPVSRAAADRR